MPQFDAVYLAILLAVLGLVFLLLARAAAALIPRLRKNTRVQPQPGGAKLLEDHSDAVIVVETGGRIRSLNARARQIFHLQEAETPNLERLARKVRPADALLRLCADEGQSRFVLEGRLVEGTSYLLVDASQTATVVTLRYPEISSGLAGGSGSLSTQTLQTFTELTQAMAASLNLDETLLAIMENVEKIVPADFMEINIWDSASETFQPYRFIGLPGVTRRLEPTAERAAPNYGISGFLITERRPLLVGDLEERAEFKQALKLFPTPIRSYIGVPLLVGNTFIGSLEFGAMAPNTFREEDVDLVRLLSGQAAIAVHNALVYRDEKRRTAELSGLAQLAHAFSSTRDSRTAFARLVESLAPLIPVEILGFLVYNESSRTLSARVPFHGLPEPVLELFRTEIQPGSPAERMLVEQDLLLTEDAMEDEKWALLGLSKIAQAASLRETALVPLSTAGHMLGYLQASNHIGGVQPFSQAELHLLMIVANQAASIIENDLLIAQSRVRAQRAESLRRISNLASSSTIIDEVLLYAVQELARLLKADVGAVFLLNPDRGEIRLHTKSVYGSRPELPERLNHLLVDDAQYPFTVMGSGHILNQGSPDLEKAPGGKALIPFYQTMLAHWEVQSMTAVPLVAQDRGVGELWFASQKENFFDQGDVQVVSTAAGWIAGVVEQANLRSQTDESLRRRVEQMTAMTRISRELSTSLDLNHLLNLVYDETLHTIRADCGTILLFDLERPQDQLPVVRFFVGDMPDTEIGPLERSVLAQDEPVIIGDFSHSQYPPPHTGVLSSLIVPITHQRRHAGLICLHGKSANQFDETSLEISQSLALQAAVALNNALAYEEQTRRGALLKRELETLSRLIHVSRLLRPNQSLPQALTSIAQAIQSATPFQTVLISVYEPDTETLRRVVGLGFPPQVWEDLQSKTQPWRSLEQLMLPEYRVGEAYYIPEDKSPAIPEDIHIVSMLPVLEQKMANGWGAQDLLLMPLFDGEQQPLGLISVDAPADLHQPDRPTYEALEVFAAQASLIIESHQRSGRMERHLHTLEQDRARLEGSAAQSQRNLPLMLHKEMEQSIALRGLNQRIERMRAALEIAAQANRKTNEQDVLLTLAGEMLTRFAMRVALIAEKSPAGIQLIKVIGSFAATANPEALFGQRNPLRQMLQDSDHKSDSSMVLVANLDSSSDWQNNTLLAAFEARSLIGFSIDMGGDRRAGVLVIGQRALPPFLEEDRRVFAQLAYQVSVGVQNVQLLNETRRRLGEVDLLLDFSRKLGTLKPDEILTNLVENVVQVLSSAQAGWVSMWEEKDTSLIAQAATGYASNQDIQAIRYALQARTGEIRDTRVVLPLRVYRTGKSERVSEVDFARQYHLAADDLQRYRRATNGRLPISAMLIPLKSVDTVMGVLFLENFETPDAFSEADEELASSFTRQAAMALENAQLFQAAQQRSTQLQALTRVAGQITSNLQREQLIAMLLDQLRLVLPYDTATLWLRDVQESLRVAAAAGFSDNEQRLNLVVAVKDSELFKTMIKTRDTVSVGDLRNDRRFPALIEPDYLSWLGIPLLYQGGVIGVIALEKREADYYTPDHIYAATTFASQAAVSLENARLYEESTARAAELDERSQRLALLNRLSSDLVSTLDSETIIKRSGEHLRTALDASGVAAVMIDGKGRYTLQGEVPQRDDTVPVALPEAPLFDHLLETQGIFQSDSIETEPDGKPLWDTLLRARDARSLLVVPLLSGSKQIGWFLIYCQTAIRYTLPEIELARTMCNQTAIAIQNARYFLETRRFTEDLERRVEERTQLLRREHKNTETLLQIITELSTSLDMSMVLNRTLNVLNESLNCEESLIVLSQGTPSHYRAGMQLARIIDGPLSGLSLERQITRWVTRSRQPVVVNRVQEDPRWEMPPSATITYQSVMAVPLIRGEEYLGALLLLHRAGGYFSQEQITLVQAIARQIGIALNNVELFSLIRDQSEHLGSMLREQQVEASRSRAILEAVADGVLVTDDQNRVTLFNASAERILNLSSGQILAKSLDYFSGLFGRAAVEWMQTIRSWSQDPAASQGAEPYSEQLDLDNGRVVSIHLSPVFWRQEFYGTVSIFRDITHEVQIDRLKSEFVANVSHELRTPMTSIKGYVEILLMGAAGELNEQQTRFLRTVKSNTERLSVLVNDLLDLSRIEAGRVSLNLQPLDIREIAEDVIADIQRRSREENKPMQVVLDAAPALPFALGDTERIRQVLGNLINNGYNYTPPGGCVTVRLREVDGDVQVDVQDNGIGISVEAQYRIFQRFFRGEHPLVLATSGTGLGLSIAKTLVEMHHGRIWFESSGVPGEGSTFSFTLPAHLSQE